MTIDDKIEIDPKNVVITFEDQGVDRFGMDAVRVSFDFQYRDKNYQIKIPYLKLQDKLEEYDIGY